MAGRDIKKVFVVGAGTMGHGIAQIFAQAGYEVALADLKPEILDKASRLIQSSLQTMADEALLAQAQIPAILDQITFTTSVQEGARRADIVIEAVVENREVKQAVFAQLDKYCSPQTLLASNTTFLNVFDFVEVSHPERLLLCHWYVPPEIIPLVDVVKGPRTGNESIELMVSVLKKVGKKPLVMNKFVAGYVVPRLQMALNREVYFLLDSGALTAEELDDAVKLGLAFRMLILGVVQRFDFGGLDLSVKGLENPYVKSQLTPPDYKPRKIFELVDQGHLGVKTGQGFYDYGGRSEAEVHHELAVRLIRLLKAVQSVEGDSFG
ncbi:3-hydroxyacyl-CoA dehydrogenase family protein [Chloroflexota bacterium]